MFQYRYAWMILGSVGDVIIFEHVCYISALEHVRIAVNRLLFKTGFINFWILGSVNYVLIKLFGERIKTEPYIMTQ